MDTNPLYSSDTWQRIYRNFLNRGIDPIQAERMATEQARTVVANDAASQRALAINEALPDSALKAAPAEDKYSGMTPAEAVAARAQDLATYKFWQAFQGAPETPREDRRPSFQKMSGLAARSQAIDPEKASEAQRLADIARQKIAASTMRMSEYEPMNDPGRTDFNQLYANLDKARGVTPEPPAAADSVEGWGRKVAGPSAATSSMDTPDVAPQDFDTWGRKVAGPSAATYSMDAPANAVGFAKRVLAANPPNRPAPAPAAAAAPAAAPAQGGNFFTRLFSGPEVQSNNQALIQRQQGPTQPGQERAVTKLNVGNSSGPEGSAADFFRADKARQELEKSGEAFTTMKRGGAAQAPGKDAALHKALEIIHHMLTRGH